MNSKPLLATFLFGVLFTLGCTKDQPAPQRTTAPQFGKAEAEAKEAARDMKDYAYAQKVEFSAKMQGQLDSLNKELDQLSAKIENSSEAVKAEAKPKLQALRDQAALLTKQLDAVKDSNESTWDSVKTTSQKALDSFKDGFQQSRQWLSDKIEP